MRILLFLLCLPGVAMAGDFSLLDGDAALSREEVLSLTATQRVEFYEGGVSHYSVGGAYSYTYAGGGTAFGRFQVGSDGVVCVDFRNGRHRCDQFVHSHGRVVMITEDGQRFPIRP
ncbi:hypothetical protein JQV27_07515 [Sulfitobacter mediterraneus]|uniref:hypothetical protein n=2 Tax=Sulfitobacter mediterraneus TaxID=83219 RepID=UPI0019318CB0|nr:hypothetical protein [Sulfitobacter mediterraneus]MBM1633398.1 hypothetical protein [Sulfitobacter mediterraneus]MBM1640468.1 hypothetical protein [Sulfitobacter mediterraneus]MBM1645263.1 hypothetical protein [Sulfitobacter mediterraneus]MBM1648588.1 hypothetical protein [Sulfitobacter mediterraneus]MBM1652608.1 hypothetical protein [Sulfitobacter mediterraneus]